MHCCGCGWTLRCNVPVIVVERSQIGGIEKLAKKPTQQETEGNKETLGKEKGKKGKAKGDPDGDLGI